LLRPPALETRVHQALKCLVCLAESAAPRRANELAQTTGIPPSETAKILYLLTWAGLISSKRGPNGGYWLRRPPTEIHIQDVMAFFQRPDEADAGSSQDSILRVWQKKGGTLHPIFEKLSLAELARESHKVVVSSGRAAPENAATEQVMKSRKPGKSRRQST
jgi:Rrf2 family protein